MSRQRDPRFSKRLVSRRLRALRDQAGRTQQDVADNMDWSISKMIRIENGTVGISTSDLKALLLDYDVTGTEAADLIAAAKDSRRTPWYDKYGEAVKPSLGKLLAYESSACALHQFQLEAVPGLLQTEDYARALLTVFTPQDLVDAAVAARVERQRHFFGDDAPELNVLLAEAVLAQTVGGAAVMAEQIRHLLAVVRDRDVSISIVPFSAGAHAGLSGSFSLLDLHTDADADAVLYREGREDREDLLTNRDNEVIQEYWSRYESLQKMAETGDRARTVLERYLTRLENA